MTSNASDKPGSTLWRGGLKLELTKAPDSFTARMRGGARPDTIVKAHHVSHAGSAERQHLEIFGVSPEARDAVMDEVRESPEVAFASHVYQVEGDPTSVVLLTDEITVQFHPEVDDAAIEGLIASHGLAPLKAVEGLPRTYIYRVTEQATENPLKIANHLLDDPRVVFAEPNIAVPAQHYFVPTDPLYREQWHLDHHEGQWLTTGSHIDAAKAWAITRGERSVVVAIADDSCDLGHVDLQGSGKIVAPYDFAGRDFSPLPDRPNDNHGTACAAVAIAEANGHGVVGVAPGCALMPIRTNGMLDDASIEELFGWAASNGAAVISCSWGPALRVFPLSTRMSNALHRAATLGRGGRGCVIFFAAGNANRPVNGEVDEQAWPAGGPSGQTWWHNGFAAHSDVIAVAACTSLARKAAYSSWGREISLCAPSNNAAPQTSGGPTYPLVRGALAGRGIVTADRVGWAGYSIDDYTRSFGGTSSACPTAAGVAALVLSANPELSAREVRQILETTADKIVDPDPDPQLGNRFGDYDAAGHSFWFGYGKVNAFKAVTEAVRRKAAGRALTMLRQQLRPALPIPGDEPAGVFDLARFAEDAILANLAIEVDIDHPSIGDLRLTLTSPGGATVILHDRLGGTAQDLRRRFDTTTTPGLSVLIGQRLQGDWKLHVQDLAAGAAGHWNSWAVYATVYLAHQPADEILTLIDTAGVGIPDNQSQGIARSLQADLAGQLREIQVLVDITHSYVGDLLVTLVSPAGTRVTLHGREGDGANNLVTTYSADTTPGLQQLRGEPTQGQWRLLVSDLEAADVGKLNRWAIRLTYAQDAPLAGDLTTESGQARAVANLKLIRGVGPAVERRLQQAGIVTFRQLAGMTPEAIAGLLSDFNGLSPERIRRQGWITQAERLAVQEQASHERSEAGEPATAVAEETSPLHYETFTLRVTLDARGNPQQTRVVHVQDGAEQKWAGWSGEEVIGFVVDQAGLNGRSAEPAQAHGPALASGDTGPEQPLTLEIDGLTLAMLPSGADEPLAEPRLRGELTFRLSGPRDTLLALQHYPYLLRFSAHDLRSGMMEMLAEMRQQLPLVAADSLDSSPQRQVIECAGSLEFALPEPGRYQLYGTVALPELNLAETAEGRVFTVVA
jgi:subtilisin-like proprotein convertase family protein